MATGAREGGAGGGGGGGVAAGGGAGDRAGGGALRVGGALLGGGGGGITGVVGVDPLLVCPCPARLGAGGGGALFFGAAASSACALRRKSLMKSWSLDRMEASTPWAWRPPRMACHEGSTFVDVNPLSASYPMCATCIKEPAVGPEIIDLSIFPPFNDFLLLLVAFGVAGDRSTYNTRL